jgi:Protein of unknown function (DUF1757)
MAAAEVLTPSVADYANGKPVVMRHVCFKCIQAGSLLGATVSVPVAYLRTGSLPSLPHVASWSTRGAGASLGAALVLGGLALSRMDAEGAATRAAKLRRNATQNRVDALSAGAAAAGVLVVASGGGAGARVMLGGACLGVASGVVLHVAISGLESLVGGTGEEPTSV